MQAEYIGDFFRKKPAAREEDVKKRKGKSAPIFPISKLTSSSSTIITSNMSNHEINEDIRRLRKVKEDLKAIHEKYSQLRRRIVERLEYLMAVLERLQTQKEEEVGHVHQAYRVSKRTQREDQEGYDADDESNDVARKRPKLE